MFACIYKYKLCFVEKSPSKKVKKVAAYKIDSAQSKLIGQDKENKKLWDEALEFTKEGGQVNNCLNFVLK